MLDELKRLEAAASGAPWAFDDETGVVRKPDRKWVADFNGGTDDDGRCAAAARNALPALIAVAEAAERVLLRDEGGIEDLTAALAALRAVKP